MSEIEEFIIDSEDDPELEEKLQRINELAQNKDLVSTQEIFRLIEEQEADEMAVLLDYLPILSHPEIVRAKLVHYFLHMKREDFSIHSTIMERLEDYWNEEIETFVLDHIQDPDEMVRVAICEILGRGKSQAGVDALRKLLQEDEEYMVRGYAAQALRLIRGRQEKDYLYQCLQIEEDDWVQANLYGELCLMGERQHLSSLLSLLDAPYHNTRIICIKFLHDLIDEQNVNIVLDKLRERLLIEDAHSVECHLQEEITYLEKKFCKGNK